MTGAFEIRSTSRITSGLTCAMSTNMPVRLSSRTSASPCLVRPSARGMSVAASAHSTFFQWVRVR